MRNAPVCLTIASVAAASIVVFSAPAEACPSPDHVDAAMSMVGSPTANGASFFTLSMMMAYGYTGTDIAALWVSSNPSSSGYFTAIFNGTYFTRITLAADIARGDVLALTSTDTYSGHTVMVRGAPTIISPQINPKYLATTQWAVPIVDATGSVHGCTNPSYPDSRCPAGSGAGTGYMRVYSDNITGLLLGHTWSVTSSSSSYHSQTARPYVVGRLTPCAPTPLSPPPPPPPP